MKKNGLAEKGFTLIELAVVLLIAATIMVGIVSMLKPYIDYTQISTTKKKMTVISDAFALFAQNYGRLPCPASPTPAVEPFGSPRLSGANGSETTSSIGCGGNIPTDYIGIVPFRALGLTEDQVRDGYNNFYTYAVSPSMVNFNAAPNSVDATSDAGLESGCTSASWKNNGSNKNIYKAHVCCPVMQAPSIRVLESNGGTKTLFPSKHAPAAGPVTPEPGPWVWYKNQNGQPPDQNDGTFEYDQSTCGPVQCSHFAPIDNAPDPDHPNQAPIDCIPTQPPKWIDPSNGNECENRRVRNIHANDPDEPAGPADPGANDDAGGTLSNSFISYVLLSHGKDGDGSFVENGPQKPQTVAPNAQEAENRNNDLTFVDRPISTAKDNTYFDDIVVWKTNDQLISHFGNNSCARP